MRPHETTIRELVDQHMSLTAARARLEHKSANPICGKPGQGFKAARYTKNELRAVRNKLIETDKTITAWINRNGKASQNERTRRFETYQAALIAWKPHPEPVNSREYAPH